MVWGRGVVVKLHRRLPRKRRREKVKRKACCRLLLALESDVLELRVGCAISSIFPFSTRWNGCGYLGVGDDGKVVGVEEGTFEAPFFPSTERTSEQAKYTGIGY
jgi:hypothetical protein